MYDELSKAKMTDKRTVIISSCDKGGFTIAQKIAVEDEGRKSDVFMKGAIIIPNIEGLKYLRDALNIAIKKETDRKNYERSSENWVE